MLVRIHSHLPGSLASPAHAFARFTTSLSAYLQVTPQSVLRYFGCAEVSEKVLPARDSRENGNHVGTNHVGRFTRTGCNPMVQPMHSHRRTRAARALKSADMIRANLASVALR